jgi:LPPG:FO 2-phospho-L-lactate transferase
MYTLSGIVDKRNGWGIADDTRIMLGALARYGEQPWFGLGDQDIATHLLRTMALRDGERLTTITSRLTKSLGILHTILPMTDEPVATMITTADQGELDFQEYFVRYRWQPVIQSMRYAGIEAAHITPEVEKAINSADVILFGPSNPWLSLLPILNVPGMRELISERDVPRVALTPIVGGQALKGPAAKIMAELNLEVTAHTIADQYGSVINGFVYDERDDDLKFDDLRTLTCDTIMLDDASRAKVAQQMLDWVAAWEGNHEHLGDHPR